MNIGVRLILRLFIIFWPIFLRANSQEEVRGGADSSFFKKPAYPGMEKVGSVPLPLSQNNANQAVIKTFVQEKVNLDQTKKPSMYDTSYLPGRIIYLNGININSIRDEELHNVSLKIDKNGNIHIHAPQYEVSSEEHFSPLMENELPQFKKEIPKNLINNNVNTNSAKKDKSNDK